MVTVSKRAPDPGLRASAHWEGGERFRTLGSSGHEVWMDADRAANQAPGPMEMVLRGLCACSATDLAIIFAKSRRGLRQLEVTASAERAPQPPRVFTRIRLVYRIAAERLDRASAERAVALSKEKYCSVFAMLERTAGITTAIELAEQEPAPGACRQERE